MTIMSVLSYMKEHLLVFDGGLGTLLQEKGLKPGEFPEDWNLSHPEVVREIHKAYFDAGSNVVSTNTFGANRLRYTSEELSVVLKAAVENVRLAAKMSAGEQEKFVALDIGPTGRLLKPYGDFDFEEAVAVFAETVRLGVDCGVDLILIETMNDSYETKAALLAVKENCDLPVFVSNAYGEDGKLMTGASPAAMVALLEGMGADAVGANCSLGPKALRGVVDELLSNASVPVFLKPNAGLPKSVDGKTVYDVLPGEFAREITDAVKRGARIVGGCCGTTPSYISVISKDLKDAKPVGFTEKNISCISSYTHTVTFGEQPILIGERINPTGKKRFKQALKEKDIGYLLQEGISQQEKGVHVLDVNVGLPEIDEVAMLTEAVCELQAVLDLPLQIDTSDPLAMEQALRHYNGKALINSVNGKESSMKAIFPLVKKYGGMVIALTLDDNGIPDTAQGRVDIAKKILSVAERYGIAKKNIVFDPLAMAISADPKAAVETLKAVYRIRHELGCHTSLGVSNVSFGLPSRDSVNSTFFAAALENGLSAAIMNPYSVDMCKTYFAYRAIHDFDPNCADYIEFCAGLPTMVTVSNTVKGVSGRTTEETMSELRRTIIKGLKDRAGELTATMLEAGVEPMTIIQQEIIPALDVVGKGFEEKTVYLPQLLMSAETAKAAFEQIKCRMVLKDKVDEDPFAFVIATVHGDIHDIGKNIVCLLMENYGFVVTDLGRDVPPEKVVEATVKLHAPLVGLSALMTTTVPAMEETIRQLRKEAPWCKIVVGGAVLTKEYADRIGADQYAKDAMETVRYAESIRQSL